jgi:hypothetical protein
VEGVDVVTRIYFAGPQTPDAIEAARKWDWDHKPLNILVSFAYLRSYMPTHQYWARAESFMLDSGAYTAYTSGHDVDIDALIAEGQKQMWDEVVGLDVIGEWQGSKRNMEYMLPRCPKAMPVFHIGDPWDLLAYYVKHWNKVGLSCRFGEDVKTSMRFYEQCFARAWPKKFHSFGWIAEQPLMAFPFHTADASTWKQPSIHRNYPFRGGGKWKSERLNIDYDRKLAADGLMMMADRFYGMQQQLRGRWAREMVQLDALPWIDPPELVE